MIYRLVTNDLMIS